MADDELEGKKSSKRKEKPSPLHLSTMKRALELADIKDDQHNFIQPSAASSVIAELDKYKTFKAC